MIATPEQIGAAMAERAGDGFYVDAQGKVRSAKTHALALAEQVKLLRHALKMIENTASKAEDPTELDGRLLLRVEELAQEALQALEERPVTL